MSTIINWQHIIETSLCDFQGCTHKADFMSPLVGDGYIHYWCEQHDPEHRTVPKHVAPQVIVKTVRTPETVYVKGHAGIYGITPSHNELINKTTKEHERIIRRLMGR